MPWIDLNHYPDRDESIGRARCGDFSLMARRLREGTAMLAELEFIADYLDGKQRVNKRKKYETAGRDFELYQFVGDLINSGMKDYLAYEAARDQFGVGPTYARKVYLEYWEASHQDYQYWQEEYARRMAEEEERLRRESTDK
jgi:hypothetical protein